MRWQPASWGATTRRRAKRLGRLRMMDGCCQRVAMTQIDAKSSKEKMLDFSSLRYLRTAYKRPTLGLEILRAGCHEDNAFRRENTSKILPAIYRSRNFCSSVNSENDFCAFGL